MHANYRDYYDRSGRNYLYDAKSNAHNSCNFYFLARCDSAKRHGLKSDCRMQVCGSSDATAGIVSHFSDDETVSNEASSTYVPTQQHSDINVHVVDYPR